MNHTMTTGDEMELNELKKLALAATGWNWNAVQGNQFGFMCEDGEFSDIGTIDADQYAMGLEDLNGQVLAYLVAVEPNRVLALIDRIERLESATPAPARELTDADIALYWKGSGGSGIPAATRFARAIERHLASTAGGSAT